MSIVIDIILLGIIALFTFIGYKQGLIKSAIKILSFFIAIAVALILYKPVSSLIIKNTNIDEKISSTILENTKIQGNDSTENSSNAIIENVSNKIIDNANNTIEDIANMFTVKIIEVVVILLLYIIARIVLRFITALTDLITKLPILKQIDKTGGIVYGFLKGIIIVHILLCIIYLISPVMKNNLSNEINNTLITKHIYNNNILLKIVF